MKKTALYFLFSAIGLLFAFSACQNGTTKPSDTDKENFRYVIFENEKYGYIDRSGKVVIVPQFDDADDFYDGLAIVGYGDRKTNYGFINTAGTIVINPQFEEAHHFNKGIAPVRLNGLWGIIDKQGEWVITPQFTDLGDVSDDGLIAAKVGGDGGKWGYINTKGEWVINPQFDCVEDFYDGYAIVRTGDWPKIGNSLYRNSDWSKNGLINKRGSFVIELTENFFGDICSKGLIPASDGKLWGYINKKGVYVIAPQFDKTRGFGDNGMAAVKIGDKWGYVNLDGKIVINPQFDYAIHFSEGLACVRIGGKYGFIDESGAFVINPQFDDAWTFKHGLAYVEIITNDGERSGCYFDTKGNRIYQENGSMLQPTEEEVIDTPWVVE